MRVIVNECFLTHARHIRPYLPMDPRITVRKRQLHICKYFVPETLQYTHGNELSFGPIQNWDPDDTSLLQSKKSLQTLQGRYGNRRSTTFIPTRVNDIGTRDLPEYRTLLHFCFTLDLFLLISATLVILMDINLTKHMVVLTTTFSTFKFLI
jgi:hypothetical protein